MTRLSNVLLSLVMAIAVIGCLVGISDGVPSPEGFRESSLLTSDVVPATTGVARGIPSVDYAEIPRMPMGPTKPSRSTPQSLPRASFDLYAKRIPSPAEKDASSVRRASRRAFNGAPPTIPHPTENTSDAACYACHSDGVRMAGLKASVMSHAFLANCMQCHAPMAPRPFQNLDSTVDHHFVGLPAPKAGIRAYPGAPPTIPHAQWMRENCHACHGGPNGWAGMESTHPWRSQCTQCHAPSANLDQAIAVEGPVPMLPPLDVVAN